MSDQLSALTHEESAPSRPRAALEIPGLLRAWRAAAGRKLGRGKPLTQAEVAAELGVSVRWYRDVERGGPGRLSPATADRLAEVLLLGPDERMALRRFVAGGSPPTRASGALPTGSLQALLDMQMPYPAYCTDGVWDLVACNQAMKEWFPWVHEPRANLLRWALASPEAREQFVHWSEHATTYLAQLRFALAAMPGNAELSALRDELLRNPQCRRLWEEEPRVVAYGDGHRYALRLPRFGRRQISVVSHVLVPAYHQDLRFVVLACAEGGGGG
ncbi:helix-turn-helix transcriptional regulator [Streptomyces sp. NPDC048595]|uniref:helix-turn-helix transcriptional regulator n=1 Tax=Streptomyces sp. NPDC048595 TaxID=3365576 RepID=UPI0037165AD8